MTTYPERVLQQAYAWMRAHPRVADCLLGAALLALCADQIPHRLPYMLGAIVVNVSLAVTVALRRLDPPVMFAGCVALVAVQLASGLGPAASPAFGLTVTDTAIVIGLYTLAAYRPRRLSLAGLAICLAGAAIAIARYAPLHEANGEAVLLLTIAAVGVTLLAAWVLGDAMAYRRAYYVSLEQLADKRARAVDASAARLRQIERDLHDGAQVRLAALALALGEIKEQPQISERTVFLVSAAHQQAKDALTELRDLARGIHPPVLDRGLAPALSVLAQTSAIPVSVDAALPQRPSPAIEAIAYFCTAELLANAAKHSGATHVRVCVRELSSGLDSGLMLTVTDDGTGEARIAPGGGLAGLLERVQTVDGTLNVDSPPGGPTRITIGLPRHA
jgi:signal transduction histidine kinase